MAWYSFVLIAAAIWIFGFLVGRANGKKIDKIVDVKNDAIDKLK